MPARPAKASESFSKRASLFGLYYFKGYWHNTDFRLERTFSMPVQVLRVFYKFEGVLPARPLVMAAGSFFRNKE